jgi:hypothetical protein
MAKFRQFSNEPFQKKMNDGTGAASVNAQVSKVLTTMRNKDLLAAEKGDWGPMMEKALMQTRRFRNDFYA